jgi:twitching motility protein PilT
MINQQRSSHIITVEDPIEFTYTHAKSVVQQRELHAHTHSFPEALKHLLRQDPNVILVGEMRDLETIAAAITISETGHLVFATLHTLDAAQTVDRIIDVFPPYQQQQIRTMLSGTLKGVVCQQLLPRKDGAGRVAAREIMVMTHAIANLIREGKTHQIYSAIQTGGQFGMITMDAAVNNLLKKGLITSEVAGAAVIDKNSLKPSGG